MRNTVLLACICVASLAAAQQWQRDDEWRPNPRHHRRGDDNDHTRSDDNNRPRNNRPNGNRRANGGRPGRVNGNRQRPANRQELGARVDQWKDGNQWREQNRGRGQWVPGSGRGYRGPGRNGGDFIPEQSISGTFYGSDGREFSLTDDERDEFFETMNSGDEDLIADLRYEHPEIFDVLAEGDEAEREDLIEYLGGDVNEVGSSNPLDIMSWMGGGVDVTSWDVLGLFSQSENTGGTAGVLPTDGGLFSGLTSSGGFTDLLGAFTGKK